MDLCYSPGLWNVDCNDDKVLELVRHFYRYSSPIIVLTLTYTHPLKGVQSKHAEYFRMWALVPTSASNLKSA